MTRGRQTALFLALALGGGWAVGAYWVTHKEAWWVSQFLMWTPGVAALVLQAIRREPPRALGFRFQHGGAWVAAVLYPFALIASCLALAYAIQAFTASDIIHFQPEQVKEKIFGLERSGLDLVPIRFGFVLLLLVPWLALAVAYRLELPERLGPGRHIGRAALWAGLFWLSPGPWWLPNGSLGEELGWRGWLVRVWRDRPLTALALTATAWPAFHIPVIVLVPELHGFVPAVTFLLSIAAAAAAFQALYLWSGSIWPPAIAHITWNAWNPFFLGSQYGGGPSMFGGEIWLINGEGVLGMIVNGLVTLVLISRWRLRERRATVSGLTDRA
jgi:membrane protease YdiL (CAAX protease family)